MNYYDNLLFNISLFNISPNKFLEYKVFLYIF